jgi:hypothetical protein
MAPAPFGASPLLPFAPAPSRSSHIPGSDLVSRADRRRWRMHRKVQMPGSTARALAILQSSTISDLMRSSSGRFPNKAMRNIIGWYLLGLAHEQDVINFLNKPDNPVYSRFP